MSPIITIIGGGPRGLSILERICAGLESIESTDRPIIHVVEPHELGAGRIWNTDQPDTVQLNVRADELTLFADESYEVRNPPVPGPSLYDWACGMREHATEAEPLESWIASVVDSITPTTFAPRKLAGMYLRWFADQLIQRIERVADLHIHRCRATSVEPAADTGELVNLSDGSTLHSDLVVVCVGHVDDAARRPAEIGSFGAYFPPGYAVDVDYSDIRPDDHVLVRGMGLAAIDSLVLLTLERGGRFLRDVTGRVRYRVSGREPKVFLTSRRGFPNLCKVDGDFRGDDFEPGFFTPERVAELLDRRPLELATDYWPLLTLEAELSYYCELFTGFPSRVRCDWGAFRREFIEAGTRAERDVLIASAVPDSAHHLNITAYLDPLSHVGAGDLRAIDSVIAQTIEAILGQRRNDPSLTSAISRGFGLAGLGDLTHDADTWSDGSRIAEFGRYSSDIKFVLGGPPASRFDELLALREAGIVRFIGARPQLRPTSSGLTVTTVHLTEPIHVDAVIDAWLPTARADRSESSLLRQLGERFGTEVRNGTTTGMIRVSHWTNRVCTGDGGDSGNNVFVVGLPSSSLLTNMIPVKGANSAILRESDAVAHAVLSAAYSSVGHLTHR